MGISNLDPGVHERRPWNAGSLVGAKRPLKPRDVWAIRFYLDEHRRMRDRALFDLAIDSKLRGCDVIKLKIGDVVSGGSIRNRATVDEGLAHKFAIRSPAMTRLSASHLRHVRTNFDNDQSPPQDGCSYSKQQCFQYTACLNKGQLCPSSS